LTEISGIRCTLQRLAWFAPLCSLACAELTDIPPGVCGNGFLEGDEECDTYTESGQSCRPPGVEGACRYDCSPPSGGPDACPKDPVIGYPSCGLDGICRRSKGTYEAFGSFLSIPAQSVQLGDFDGDGRQDLLALGNASSLQWQSLPRFLFFDKTTGQLQDVFDPRMPISSPTIVRLDQTAAKQDLRRQVVFGTGFGIGTFEISSDREVLPIAYPFQQMPENWLYRMVRVRGTTENSVKESVLIFMGQNDSDSASPGEIAVAESVSVLAPMPKPVNMLAGEPVAANVVEGLTSPCEEVLFAFQGDNRVYMLEPCDSFGKWLTSTQPPISVLSLTGNHTISQTPIAAKVNKEDSLIDLVLVDESGTPHVAFGKGDGSFVADLGNPDATLGKAWPVTVVSDSENCAVASAPDAQFPLAAGDLNGDGIADWVLHNSLQLTRSMTINPAAEQIEFQTCAANWPSSGQWSSAAIANLNGDGLPDVIAGSSSSPDLDFLQGTGLDSLNPSGIVTGGLLSHLVVGDFDGDLINDVAFSERIHAPTPTADSPTEELAIAYGNFAGAPGPPIEIGELSNIKQLQSAKYVGDDAIDELGVTSQSDSTTDQMLTMFIGTAGRHPISPLGLVRMGQNDASGIPLASTVGTWGQNGANSLGLVALAVEQCGQGNCPYRVWFVPATDQGTFGAPEPSAVLPSEFVPYRKLGMELSAYVRLGDVDGDGASDALLFTTSGDDTTIDVWRVNPPQPGSDWMLQNPLQLLTSSPGRLNAASNPTLIDLDGDGGLDLVLIVEDVNGRQQLGVVWNRAQSLPLADIVFVDLGGSQEARGFSSTLDRNGTRLVAITDQASYGIDISTDGKRLLTASPIKLAIGTTGEIQMDVPGGNSIAIGDMTGDGLMDLVIGTTGGVQIFAEVPTRK
jgi:hypothetical protein